MFSNEIILLNILNDNANPYVERVFLDFPWYHRWEILDPPTIAILPTEKTFRNAGSLTVPGSGTVLNTDSPANQQPSDSLVH